MRIITDNQILHAEQLFSSLGEVVAVPYTAIHHETVRNADILLVRSVTRVDEALLGKSRVQFIGTATSGLDHIDQTWLAQAGIAWAHAQGCNAIAVTDYVTACIAALRVQGHLNQSRLRAAVMGVGRVGKEVVKRLQAIGFEVLLNDPPRAEQEHDFISTPLNELADLDVITLHVPLTFSGAYPTYHLIDSDFLTRQRKGCVLINAARGPIIDGETLKRSGNHLIWCLDVWEKEPQIDPELVRRAFIATPHIAGYTFEAKERATRMLYNAAVKTLELPLDPITIDPTHTAGISFQSASWEEAVLSVYNPLIDTAELRRSSFSTMRYHYPLRHENFAL